MAKRPSLNPLPDILARFLKTHGMAIHMLECRLQQHWLEIVGEHVARHTWPDSVRHRKLYLVAENSVWLQQLLFLKPELLAKINAAADGEALTDIVLRVGTVPSPDAGAGPSSRPAPAEQAEEDLSVETRTAIDATVQAVADPDLQTRLKALFSKSAP
ncbi:MAG: DUF721 domain-containing protein [Nitrospirae bacterium]|nr:MAG: DUF721 domain-containing protein [Nitrospirota bacterium]